MFLEPFVTDKQNKIVTEKSYSIEIDVWRNKLTKRKHLMVYIHPIGTYIGDDLWSGFKFHYDELDDYDSFLKKLFAKYQKSIAVNKRKGKLEELG